MTHERRREAETPPLAFQMGLRSTSKSVYGRRSFYRTAMIMDGSMDIVDAIRAILTLLG